MAFVAAFLTDVDRQVLKKYHDYISKNTTNSDDVFTHLFQEGVIDDETLEKLFNKAPESAKMRYFVQTNMSRWTYAEMKTFCTILMAENSHVAKVLWPIVFTVDPSKFCCIIFLILSSYYCFVRLLLLLWFYITTNY